MPGPAGQGQSGAEELRVVGDLLQREPRDALDRTHLDTAQAGLDELGLELLGGVEVARGVTTAWRASRGTAAAKTRSREPDTEPSGVRAEAEIVSQSDTAACRRTRSPPA